MILIKYFKVGVFVFCLICSFGFTKKREDNQFKPNIEYTKLHHDFFISQQHDMHTQFKPVKKVQVTATAYTASVKENGPHPFITASGEHVREGIIAVSHDLFKNGFTFNRRVLIVGSDGYDGVYKVKDTMHKRKKRMIDIFRWRKKEADDFGKRGNIELVLLDDSANNM